MGTVLVDNFLKKRQKSCQREPSPLTTLGLTVSREKGKIYIYGTYTLIHFHREEGKENGGESTDLKRR